MPKTCISPDCTYPVFGKGYCRGHQWKRSDKKSKVNKPVRIKPMSKNLSKEREKYRKLRLEFLEKPDNMFCAVYPHLRADQIHHTRGRGKNLNKVETWLAVSDPGHKWIEENPKLARERGFTKSRLHMTDNLNENV